MKLQMLLLILLAIVCHAKIFTQVAQTIGGQAIQQEEGKFISTREQPPPLIIVAPAYIRPNSSYHVSISLVNCTVPATVEIKLITCSNSNRNQVVAKSVQASSHEIQLVDFSIGDWPAASYVLTVNATAVDNSWNFTAEKGLTYEVKDFSCFIQTDKATYKPGDQVQLRIIFLSPTFTPAVLNNEISVTVRDPIWRTYKQWWYLTNYRGLLSLDIPLNEVQKLGTYNIRVSARGCECDKKFTVEYQGPPTNTVDVTIELPSYITVDTSNILATVKASYSDGKPVQGYVTLTVEGDRIINWPVNQYKSRLTLDGIADFNLSLAQEHTKSKRDANLRFAAVVKEDVTGYEYNQTQTLPMYLEDIKIHRLYPGANRNARYPLRYRVCYQDDIPVEDDGPEVELRYTGQYDKPIGTFRLRPRGGLIEHKLDIEPSSNSLGVSAYYMNRSYPLEPIYISRNPDLFIETESLRLRAMPSINDKLKFEVSSNEPMQQLTCQGLSRGDIVWAMSRQVINETKLEFDIKLERSMGPDMLISCFTVSNKKKELLADAIKVPLSGLVSNEVELSASNDETKPGQEVVVSVSTKPDSLVFLLGIDQSALLRRSLGKWDKSREDYFKIAESYDPGLFLYRGFEGYDPFDDSNAVLLTNTLFKTRREIWPPVVKSSCPRSFRPGLEPVHIRLFFPETWIWQNGTADSRGQIKFNVKIPDALTSWQLSAFSVSESHGLGLTSELRTVREFKQFFIRLNLPPSIIRHEKININPTVHNYSKKPAETKVTLDNENGEFEFVDTDNGVKKESRLVTVPAESSSTVSFLVKPLKLGQINVRIAANAGTIGDSIVKKVLVKPPGKEQQLDKTMPISRATVELES